jgi:haloacetate dehalogenase
MFEGFTLETERSTVIAPDLRGYGKTTKPPWTPDHALYSKRVMALDQIDLMGPDRSVAPMGHRRPGVRPFLRALPHRGGARRDHRRLIAFCTNATDKIG